MHLNTKKVFETMCRPNKKNGFTLIEVLVSIVIIVIGILAVMGLTIIVIKGNLLSNRVTTATTMALSLIEEATNVGYDNVSTMTAIYGSTNEANNTFMNTNGATAAMGTIFDSNDFSGVIYDFCMYIQTDTALWSEPDVTDLENVAHITVDVSWGSGSSNTVHKNVELRTIIAQ